MGYRTGGEISILALNCGSSSLKFGLYSWDGKRPGLVCEGEAEEIGRDNSSFWFKGSASSEENKERIRLPDHMSALRHALDSLKQQGASEPEAVGHRFVHGGPRIREHQRVTQRVLEELRSAVDYAPLHVPSALAVLEAAQQVLPRARQCVCLDTAFHATIPDVAKVFALPQEVRHQGVERYGFHGLSLESIVAQLRPCPARLVIAHLGNGSSITAVRDGRSIDTSMGLTPTGGVMMGTRCGDLDPGVVIFLVRHAYGTADALEDLLCRHSGLLGVSGTTSDVRGLLSARKQNSQADLALRMFSYQVRKAIGAMAAALGGMDTVVFTGGIGEHATEVRSEICSGLEFLGDFRCLVLPAQEDLQIASITAKLLEENS